MRAILFARGKQFRLYSLENKDGNEVKSFFNRKNEKNCRGYIFGFIDLIRRIADEGTGDLTKQQRKCWRVRRRRGRLICELRKGPWRISYFRMEGNRIILTTVFGKTRSQEDPEYIRAVDLIEQFLTNPCWEE